MRMIALIAASIALGATDAAADPCKTQGAPDAKELTFDFTDQNVLDGLYVAFQLGLMPPEFPNEDIKKIANPCSRGTLPIGDKAVGLRGENDDSPPRWAQPGADGPVIYVALMPQPEPARLWRERTRPSGKVRVKFADNEWMYAVVFSAGANKRMVFHFFDKIPEDARLKALLEPILAGNGRWQVGFDMATKQVVPNTK